MNVTVSSILKLTAADTRANGWWHNLDSYTYILKCVGICILTASICSIAFCEEICLKTPSTVWCMQTYSTCPVSSVELLNTPQCWASSTRLANNVSVVMVSLCVGIVDIEYGPNCCILSLLNFTYSYWHVLGVWNSKWDIVLFFGAVLPTDSIITWCSNPLHCCYSLTFLAILVRVWGSKYVLVACQTLLGFRISMVSGGWLQRFQSPTVFTTKEPYVWLCSLSLKLQI